MRKKAEVDKLGNVLLGKLMDLPIRAKYVIAAKAGLDLSEVPDAQDNARVNPGIVGAFAKLDFGNKQLALPIVAEAIATRDPDQRDDLSRLLRQHGYEYVDGGFVPVGLIDARETPYLPPTAASELTKAISRLSDNDLSGAITAACGAVDATTTALYEKHSIGNPSASFQTKVNTALSHLRVFESSNETLLKSV